MNKAFVAIDCENIWCSVRDKFGIEARLDFEKLIQFARGNESMDIALAKAYIVTDKFSRITSFLTSLKKMGYEVDVGYSTQQDGSKMDVALAVDAIKHMRKYTHFILCSGDGDFVPLLEYLKEKGKNVKVVSTHEDISSKLMKTADDVYFIQEDLIYKVKGEQDDPLTYKD